MTGSSRSADVPFPPSASSAPGRGLAPTRAPLDNGALVIVRETRKTPAVTINIALRAGAVFDPPDRPGATHLLTRVLDRGTATRSAADIAADLDSRGISLAITANRHLFSVVCTCLSEDFAPVLALIGDLVTRPALPEIEIALRKGEVVTAIRQDEDNPATRAVEGLMALLYGEQHPYGRRLKGTKVSVEAIDRDVLLGVHAARFAPPEMTIVVVGDVAAPLAMDCAAEVFGGWQASAVPAPELPLLPPASPSSRRRSVIRMPNKAQADIAYGFTTIRRSDPAYYAYWLMNNALGQYALGGRLGDRIREREGMAYYVSTVFEANVLPGPLIVRAGVSPANVDRALASIDDELLRLCRAGLSQAELDESRQYLIGSLPRALETNAGIAAFLQVAEFFDLGPDYDVQLPALLRTVTLAEVNDAAAALDPTRATVVVAGPYAEGPE